MKRYRVVLSPEAEADLNAIYDWIANKSSPEIAFGYISRIEAHLRSFDTAPMRGTVRNDVRPGLRVTGLERRVTIAFTVAGSDVVILRLFYGGQNWTDFFTEADE